MLSLRTTSPVIAFEGLHRAGKGTQLKLAQDYLAQNKLSSKIMRGDGSREGIGSKEYYDPESSFWQNIRHDLYRKDMSGEENFNAWHFASQKLNSELASEVGSMHSDIVLSDRSSLSRMLALKQQFGITSYGTDIKPNLVIPYITFILLASQSELLRRNSSQENSKREFRARNIRSNFPDFMELIQRLYSQSPERYVIIDAEKDPAEISEEINGKLQSILF